MRRGTAPRSSTAFFHIPADLVVKSQVADIIDLLLQLIGYPNGVHRPCRNRKSRGAVLSTSEGQWATTKFDGVWMILYAALDPAVASRARRGDFVRCLDHFDLLQTARN